jgi:hypothetical protein
MRDRDVNSKEEMIPFFSVASKDFERNLDILKKILYQFEQRTHSENAENAYTFSTEFMWDLSFGKDIIPTHQHQPLPAKSVWGKKRNVYTCSLLPSVSTTDLIHYYFDQGECSYYSCYKYTI